MSGKSMIKLLGPPRDYRREGQPQLHVCGPTLHPHEVTIRKPFKDWRDAGRLLTTRFKSGKPLITMFQRSIFLIFEM